MMYWPMGAAQIYSANRRRRKDWEKQDNVEKNGTEQDEDCDPILGMRTSRNGHLIATITTTTMTIWQASVRYPGLSFSYF